MAITFPTAPVVTPNRIRYIGVVGAGAGQGDITRAAILAALPAGALKTALAGIAAADWSGDNLLNNLKFAFMLLPFVGLGAPQAVPISIDSLVVADVPLLRFYVPAGAVGGLFIFEVAFNHSIFR
jgi:hypothetical protein